MSLIISKHAYRRARQRLGLNKKAFKRAIDNNLLHPDYKLVVDDNIIVTVVNMCSADRPCKTKLNKEKAKEHYNLQDKIDAKRDM